MGQFDYFVVFAEMRTGSNFLEANLNSIDGLRCLGEAFNPHFISFPNAEDCLGVTLPEREAQPEALIEKVKQASGLAGFRYFHDHDPRVFDIALEDPRCAKVILTRNPADTYVSRKIAAATGQWKLTDMKHHKAKTIHFDGPEFEEHVEELQGFQVRLLNALQTKGQTAFYIAYEDLQDVDVMNGLAAWLGIEGRIEKLDKTLKKQNPTPLSEKVSNFPEMQAELARYDRFDLGRTPTFEPRRGPAIPTYLAAADAPLIYMPIRSGPEPALRDWLSSMGGVVDGFKQGELRKWMRANAGHRAFTVLRHPVARAHTAYRERILATGEGTYPKIREALRTRYKIPLPDGPSATTEDLRVGFLGFLGFLKGNLAGQSSIRVDSTWASQFEIVSGFSRFRAPDRVIRETELVEVLTDLAAEVGASPAPITDPTDPFAADLALIYDPTVEAAARDAYARDYEAFGFGDWSAS